MPLLFSYGTLQLDTVQLAVFGRLLQGRADELVGFEASSMTIEDPETVALSGKTQHTIVTFNGRNDSRVAGTVFEVTDEELAKADAYEVEPYARVAATLASGRDAWVYVDSRAHRG